VRNPYSERARSALGDGFAFQNTDGDRDRPYATGKVTATRAATLDGSYRLVFAGDAVDNTATSAADYVDVQ
jgi:hypothetical protein